MIRQSILLPGYYAIGYDDLAYGTSNQCNISLVATYNSPMLSTVTQITACNNPGSNGIGQFYLFNVQKLVALGVANIPISLQFDMPNGGNRQTSLIYIFSVLAISQCHH